MSSCTRGPIGRPRALKTVLYLLLLTFCILETRVAIGQGATASITGTVVDPQGLPIPGATLALTNLDTNGIRSATTNEDGQYVFAVIVPGHYSLAGSKEGFATVRASAFEHTVNEAATRDFHLAVGTTTTAATVQSSAVSLET